ncbi:RNA polymerase II transcription factor B subunit 1 [Linnemannia schmuckeri]|uniref:RNA polymerase II transcription factor B subunit 1 n=1 Tax=Linnemannia schmuckeri TaxID=64567 RepID=A0A9P5VDX8_9FUNG|nr:RNA polymerase II transcription factor B subunit 1 [Linnemannia schmuckeri]
MWEAGETVTAQGAAVYRKRPGILFFTNRRLAWVPDGGLAPTVSVKHDEIRVQFVSAEGRARTTLRVAEFKPDVFHTFQFTSNNAIQEREVIKGLISHIIHDRLLRASGGGVSSASGTPGPSGGSGASPGASSVMSDASAPGTPKTPLQARMGGPSPAGLRRGVNGAGGVDVEMQTRRALLAQNRELSLLHTELVVGKHISENEFWETRKSLLRNKAAIDQQQKGQSSAWLDLKPQTGESNDVKYVMTPQVIHSVCQQYPSIKRAYDQFVPDKLSEAEFWKRYFQSRFFHRSRSGRGANEPDDEIFDKALEEDEEETKSAPKRIKLDHINRLVDLSTTEEDHLESYLTPDGTMNAGKTKESKEAMPLIRRFNRYAQRVLNSTIGPKRPSTGPESLDMSGVERAIVMEDLQEQKESSKIVLNIQDTRRYFESQGGDMKSSKIPDGVDPEDILKQFYRDYTSHEVVLNKPFAIPENTFETLMRNVKSNRAKLLPPKDGSQLLPPHLYQEALSCHAAGNEILRHFWASTSMDKAAKHLRMIESLKKIRDENVKSLMIQASSLGTECLDAMKMMLKPMLNGIQKALKHADSRPKPPVRKLA